MVHPYLYEKDNVPENVTDLDEFLDEKVLTKVKSLLSRIHVAIVGPGLGRDQLMLKTLEIVIKHLEDNKIPIVVDADGLFLLSQKPDLIKGNKLAILTPNVVEFKRIADAVGVELDNKDPIQETKSVSKALGGVTILRKGATDIIVQGDEALKSDVKGSDRRAGGQGDSLSGTIATLVAWGQAYKSGIWDHPDEISQDQVPLLACFGGSTVTRVAAREAFKQKGRAMQATDLHANVGNAYQLVFEDSKGEFKL